MVFNAPQMDRKHISFVGPELSSCQHDCTVFNAPQLDRKHISFVGPELSSCQHDCTVFNAPQKLLNSSVVLKIFLKFCLSLILFTQRLTKLPTVATNRETKQKRSPTEGSYSFRYSPLSQKRDIASKIGHL